MTTETTSLRVYGGSRYLADQEVRLRRTAARLQPLGYGAAALALAGWLGFIIRPILITENNATLLALLSLAALALPFAVSRLEHDADQYAAGRLGEAALTDFLAAELTADWSLLRNVVLPDQGGDIDAVLVGPRGVWVLEVKAYSRHYRNAGDRWWRRTEQGEWDAVRYYNPTRQARRGAHAVRRLLAERVGDVPVTARIVWAGDGVVLTDKPAVAVWQLAQPQPLRDDLAGGLPLPPDRAQAVVAALLAVNGDDSAESTPALATP